MNLPTDMKSYAPSEDAFVIFNPEECIVGLCCLAVLALLFAPWIK